VGLALQQFVEKIKEDIYVDASADCNDLVFYLGATGYSYSIRITQYNCEYENLAPKGCTEYLFGEQTGYIYTYNWDDGNGYHLANQEQNICIRREKDYCEICYSTVTNKDFGVSAGGGGFASANYGTIPSAAITSAGFFRNQGCCGYGSMGNSIRPEYTKSGNIAYLYWPVPRRDCVIIPGLNTPVSSQTVQFSNICGNAGLGGSASAFIGGMRTGKFSGSADTTKERTLCTMAQPFTVMFSSDNFEGVFEQATTANIYRGDKGFKLSYKMQTTC